MDKGYKGVGTGIVILIGILAAWTWKLHSHFGWNIIFSVLAAFAAFFLTAAAGMLLTRLFGIRDDFAANAFVTVMTVVCAVCALIFL